MMWWIASFAVVFCLCFLVFKRKRRKRHITKPNQDPCGLWLYHSDTQIKIREAIEEPKRKTAKGENQQFVGVIHFKGDMRASERKEFSKLVDEVVLNKESFKEVLVSVESPGGGVSEYGFLYSEMERLRQCEAHFKLTVLVDTVAASGGYLMSIPAHKIVAAPFSMIGSVGVVSFIPNIRELLEKNNIKPRTFTAGDYKRTVTLTDDADEETVKHFEEQLSLIHSQFKQALKKYRPHVDLDKVATGEAWLASTTMEKELGLVDELKTSGEILLEWNREASLLELKSKKKPKSWWQRRVRSLLQETLEKGLFTGV